MNAKKLASILGITLLTAVSGLAQEKPGNIAALEFQTPKNGMVKQYEEGRKQKAEWHKQQKDTQPLYVWEIVSGEHTGTYIVGRLRSALGRFRQTLGSRTGRPRRIQQGDRRVGAVRDHSIL